MSVTKMKDKVMSEVKDEKSLDPYLSELSSDVSSLRDDFAKLVSHIGDLASASSENVGEKGEQLFNHAREGVETASEDVKGRVRQRPLTAIALAAGAGALIAALSRK
ncbi:hypothetical protein [Hirschia baltica]|uniref:DUF883 domain-containing protein n=1 Tax=Hirschia baltica (strain ATCC 49814 / DSM 5838 / IFAM 1418) TaxID=582402 RepID=C6XLB4_HIRBI|nr:hypothetical protein [Hirschia baltica]ACT59713.1 protein of unknown function DUF883 ElaB [Hirschia baltica ATCC 49814]